MKERNEEYEKKFGAYLFSFDFETHKKICGNINVKPNIPNNKKNIRLNINNNGVEIDGVLINEKIFQEEMINWCVEDRETQIDHLIDWIGECRADRQSDKYLMKEDLTTLIKRGNNGANQTFFSSILTNEYIFWDESEFDEICDEILELNKTI